MTRALPYIAITVVAAAYVGIAVLLVVLARDTRKERP